MFLKIIIVICVTAWVNCKSSHIITGPSWKNEIRKCASGGGDDRTYTFELKTLGSIGLKYNDVNRSTSIVAHGRLEVYTKGTGLLKEPSMSLTAYSQENNYKIFSNSWTESARLGWAYQECRISLNIKIYQDGSVELNSYVYAGSWGAVTCSETKAYVEKIEIII